MLEDSGASLFGFPIWTNSAMPNHEIQMKHVFQCVGGPMDGSGFEVEVPPKEPRILEVHHNGREHIAGPVQTEPPFGPGPSLGFYQADYELKQMTWTPA